MLKHIDRERLKEALSYYRVPFIGNSEADVITFLFAVAGFGASIFLPIPDGLRALVAGVSFLVLGVEATYRAIGARDTNRFAVTQLLAESALRATSIAAGCDAREMSRRQIRELTSLRAEIESEVMESEQKAELLSRVTGLIGRHEADLETDPNDDPVEFSNYSAALVEFVLGRPGLARFLTYDSGGETDGDARTIRQMQSQAMILNALADEVRSGLWKLDHSQREIRQRVTPLLAKLAKSARSTPEAGFTAVHKEALTLPQSTPDTSSGQP